MARHVVSANKKNKTKYYTQAKAQVPAIEHETEKSIPKKSG